MEYLNFAPFYDLLTRNVEYEKRALRIRALAKRFLQTDTDGTLLLDLACGSGSFSEALARLGYDVIGVDSSPAMLGAAMDKKLQSGLPIQYLCQDMRELDMFGTIDITTCMLDSLNHLPSLADVQRVFDRVSLFAQPGGLFLFDMNTLYKHREILADKVFLYDLEEVFCTWDNRLLEDGETVEMQLTFFSQDPETGLYDRTDECITERAYPQEEIESALARAGLVLLGTFDADAGLDTPEVLSPVTETTERILFAAGKPTDHNTQQQK
ncbi:MAG: methyltransferase domain-containing protein [Oscillospiraceae bacterium]|nr:methyltransferase domain-containing protein [Oscillospiraceae bacterium]